MKRGTYDAAKRTKHAAAMLVGAITQAQVELTKFGGATVLCDHLQIYRRDLEDAVRELDASIGREDLEP